MSLHLSWYLENRVILVVSKGKSLNQDQDMFDIDQAIVDYINQSDAPLVHLITDFRDGSFSPSMKAVGKLQSSKHPRIGWAIVIGQMNSLQRFSLAMAISFFKLRNRMVDTLEEALDFLNYVDSTLPPLRDGKLDKAS